MSVKLTKAQRARLEKLATYLEGLPEDYCHFTMSTCMASDDLAAVVTYALNNGGVASCGTVACALGHGPAAGVLASKNMIETDGRGRLFLNWEAYATLFVSHVDFLNDWCFGASWRYLDDTHLGAAARIRLLLDKGEPPEEYMRPDHESVPLYAPYRIDAKAPASPEPTPTGA